MHDPKKSDSGIVATKPTNKAGLSRDNLDENGVNYQNLKWRPVAG